MDAVAAGEADAAMPRRRRRLAHAAQATSRAAHAASDAAAHKAAAQKLFGGRNFESLKPGTAGGNVTAALDFVELASDWARNVVGIIPGSDPKLRHEYVAIGAHNDHIGITTRSTTIRSKHSTMSGTQC